MPTKLCLPSTDNRSKGTIFRLIHKENLQKRVYTIAGIEACYITQGDSATGCYVLPDVKREKTADMKFNVLSLKNVSSEFLLFVLFLDLIQAL